MDRKLYYTIVNTMLWIAVGTAILIDHVVGLTFVLVFVGALAATISTATYFYNLSLLNRRKGKLKKKVIDYSKSSYYENIKARRNREIL